MENGRLKGSKSSIPNPQLKIEVVAYSGYRVDETPRSFRVHGKRIDVTEILEIRLEEDSENRTRKRVFRIKGSDGSFHTLGYDEEAKEWFYVI